MAKKVKIKWLSEPEEQDYPAALSYLSLLYEEHTATTQVDKLRHAPLLQFKAKDIFRASGLSLLGISNTHVKKATPRSKARMSQDSVFRGLRVCRYIFAGSRSAHDFAAFEGLLLAIRHAGMTIRRKVIDGKQAIMGHVRIERQQQCWALLDDPHSRVTTSMYPPFVTFGTLEPTLQIQLAFRTLL